MPVFDPQSNFPQQYYNICAPRPEGGCRSTARSYLLQGREVSKSRSMFAFSKTNVGDDESKVRRFVKTYRGGVYGKGR